jgi:hypothetical protein
MNHGPVPENSASSSAIYERGLKPKSIFVAKRMQRRATLSPYFPNRANAQQFLTRIKDVTLSTSAQPTDTSCSCPCPFKTSEIGISHRQLWPSSHRYIRRRTDTSVMRPDSVRSKKAGVCASTTIVRVKRQSIRTEPRIKRHREIPSSRASLFARHPRTPRRSQIKNLRTSRAFRLA